MKKIINWQNNYSVQIHELDEEHKKLIDIINELYDAYLNNIHQDKITHIVSEMHDYAAVHFKTEEKYFEEFGYREKAEHKAEHEAFLEKMKTFELDYQKNSKLLSLQILNFLQEWLNNHIMKSDKKYIPCFKSNGLK